MSVLIKGMEMPEGCFGCELSLRWYNGPETVLQCNVLQKLVSDDGLKDPDCPLVPVPPHGRLIDANALLADVRAHSESYFADDFAHEWVDVAPTIIPADKDGET